MTFRVWGLAATLMFCAPALADEARRPAAPVKPGWCLSQAAEGVGPGDARFAQVSRKFIRREPVSILAVGSSSTAGSDLSDPRLAYPTHLEAYLNAQFGAGRVTVINKGKGGEAIADTVRRFEKDVLGAKPDLVIWQLGANDIVRGVPVEDAARGVAEGLAALRAAGVPVVLMDSQAAPKVLRGKHREAMDRMLRESARAEGAPYWSRFDLMKAILVTGEAGEADLTRPDDLHMTVPMHVCTAVALGDALGGYLRSAPVTASAPIPAQR